VRYGSIRGLEYEVPQSRLYCLCINVALCSTALLCICRVIRRSSMTMKAHTYYIIFGRPPIGGSFPPPSLAAPLVLAQPASRGTRNPTIHESLCMLVHVGTVSRSPKIRGTGSMKRHGVRPSVPARAHGSKPACCSDDRKCSKSCLGTS